MKARNEKNASNRLLMLLSVLLLTSVILALLSYLHTERWFEYNNRYMAEVASQQILAQQLAKHVVVAQRGEKTSFGSLRKARNDFHNSISIIKNGIDADGLPPSPSEVLTTLNDVEQEWLALQDLVDKILISENTFGQINNSIATITNLGPKLELVAMEIAKAMVSLKSSNGQVLAASNQVILLKRIENNITGMLTDEINDEGHIKQLRADVAMFDKTLKTMLNGGDLLPGIERIKDQPTRERAEDLARDFKVVASELAKLITLAPEAKPVFDAINQVSQLSEKVDQKLKVLLASYRTIPGRISIFGLPVGHMTVLVFGILATIFLVLLGGQILTDARRRELETKALNETNQKAILRLLDEMGDLADGDLTVAATVTEDITGAIADSINYAIEALRNLVTTINDTSEKITGAAQESRNITMHLAEASEHQAQQIAVATTAIRDMTIAIDGMARNAKESADVANRAVAIANKGAETVQNTIKGMNTMREQIQETSKRIKLLGESAQEIGDIVEIIDDIADQTNILALNAAMQAAMAGEAGRGFAVVADEVQRLAERSGNATKQIETLVKTIQADTNEAVASMEVSTAGVVKGAKLAEDAGEALGEIKRVSNYIDNLTREIANSASHESRETSKVDKNMSVIQEITSQTAEGTRQTAAAVGTLAELAEELQRSVAGFRLPH